MKKILFALGALVFCSACSSIVKLPAGRLESPEASGKQLQPSIQMGDKADTAFVLSPDIINLAPNLTNPLMKTDDHVFFSAGLGLLDRMDIFYEAAGGLKLKYQFVGAPKSSAGAGNFSVASTFSVAGQHATQNATDIYGDTASNTLHQTIYDGALLFGYRIAQWLLPYTSIFYTHDSFENMYTLNGVSTNADDSASSFGADIGLEIGVPKASIRLEGDLVHGKLEQAHGWNAFFSFSAISYF